MAVAIIVSIMQSQQASDKTAVTPTRAVAQVRQQVLTDVGPITAALGLLINLVESDMQCRQQLKVLQLQDDSQLLCTLMQVRTSSCRMHALAKARSGQV